MVEVRASQASGNPSQEFVACGSADVSQAEPSQIYSFVITNLSGSKLFRDVSLLVTTPTGSLRAARLVAIAPAAHGRTSLACTERLSIFRQLDLHPEWSFRLDIAASVDAEPVLRLESSPAPLNLKYGDLETWLVLYESQVLGYLLGIPVILLGGALVFIERGDL